MNPRYFRDRAAFRTWLLKNHAAASEILVGYYKKDSGKPSLTWPESVDEALCFGWIDGIRRSIDAASYSIRFTPRKPRSIWSAVNIKRAKELIALNRMQPAGLRAFEARTDDKSAVYSYEQRHAAALPPDLEKRFRVEKKAWEYFEAQPPSYRKAAIWWVVSAKREETQQRRLAKLIDDSNHGRRIPALAPYRRTG